MIDNRATLPITPNSTQASGRLQTLVQPLGAAPQLGLESGAVIREGNQARYPSRIAAPVMPDNLAPVSAGAIRTYLETSAFSTSPPAAELVGIDLYA